MKIPLQANPIMIFSSIGKDPEFIADKGCCNNSVFFCKKFGNIVVDFDTDDIFSGVLSVD
jgi:hypothetical protein